MRIVLVVPHSPLPPAAHGDHLVGRLEGSEDIEQDVVSDHHLFEQVDDLGEGQAPQVRQSVLDALDHHLHRELLIFRPALDKIHENLCIHLTSRAFIGTIVERGPHGLRGKGAFFDLKLQQLIGNRFYNRK